MALTNGSKSWSSRKRGLVFTAVVFVIFMQAGLYASQRHSFINSAAKAKGKGPDIAHPIPTLMAEAEDKFRNLLTRQSKTLAEAVAEYRRRYSREPPRGFDAWWGFTVEHNVKMIDEYDGLMEDLAPFWELSGDEVRRRALQVGQLPYIDLVRVQGGKATPVNVADGQNSSEVSTRAIGFARMMVKFQDQLPDMDFPINAKSEGRVLVPWEHRKFPNMTEQDSSVGLRAMLGGEFTADWQGTGNVWDSFRRVCAPEAQARRLFGSVRLNSQAQGPISRFDADGLASAPGTDFAFSGNLDSKYNFCENPWAHYQQGHFFSDWRTIPVLYPVFSPGKAPGYSDIRVPSHYYHTPSARYTYGWDSINQRVQETDNMEVPWQNKSDVMFWRGATTGGGSSPAGFAAHYQRHRFVRMTSDHSNSTRTVVYPEPPSSQNFVQAKLPVSELNSEIADVAFVKSTGYANYPGGRAAMRKAHRFAESVTLGEHWKYKYLVDLDGNGYSARFLAFLASDSAVLKSTVYSEYFSDWIQPWLHFIPVSQTYQEIYNIYAFFTGPTQAMLKASNSSALYDPSILTRSEDGDKRLRRIARAGRQWSQTIGRPVDMESYVYRLCLEWARLWADDRDSMDFAFA